jgi:hypothetical protein
MIVTLYSTKNITVQNLHVFQRLTTITYTISGPSSKQYFLSYCHFTHYFTVSCLEQFTCKFKKKNQGVDRGACGANNCIICNISLELTLWRPQRIYILYTDSIRSFFIHSFIHLFSINLLQDMEIVISIIIQGKIKSSIVDIHMNCVKSCISVCK